MDIGAGLGLVAIVGLVLANGFFVATEFAIVAVRRSRLEELVREGRPGARGARHIVEHLDAYIAACQLGITMTSLALGWLGEPALARLLEPPLAAVAGRFAPAAAHGVAVGVAFAVITALHIVVGELAPKGLALQRPEGTALWVARPLQAFYAVFRWPIVGLNAVGNATLRLAGLEPAAGHEMVHSVEELRLLVRASREAGLVEESEARIASRAFRFADLTAGALMTPRTAIDGVPVTLPPDELLARAAASRHSRLIVYEGTLDNVLGVLRVRDLVGAARAPGGPPPLRTLLRPALTVPETKAADDLLEDMRAGTCQLAVVVDEYGGTAGIVTLGDLAEALIGPVGDEARQPVEARQPELPRPEGDGSLLLDGLTRLDELEDLAGLVVGEEDRAQVETVGGLIMARLDRLPRVGDEVALGDRRLRVEGLEGRRAALLRLLPPSATPATDGPDPPEA